MGHIVGVVFAVVVGFIGLALAILAMGAAKRSGRSNLYFLAGAFSLFAVKAVVAVLAADDLGHIIGHAASEIAQHTLDLAIVLLIVAPLLRG